MHRSQYLFKKYTIGNKHLPEENSNRQEELVHIVMSGFDMNFVLSLISSRENVYFSNDNAKSHNQKPLHS